MISRCLEREKNAKIVVGSSVINQLDCRKGVEWALMDFFSSKRFFENLREIFFEKFIKSFL